MRTISVGRSAYWFGQRTNSAGIVTDAIVQFAAGLPPFRGIAIHPDSEVRGVIVTPYTAGLTAVGGTYELTDGSPYLHRIGPDLRLSGLDHTDGELLLYAAESEEDIETLAGLRLIRGSTEVTLFGEITAAGREIYLNLPRTEDDRTRAIVLQLTNPGALQLVNIVSRVYDRRGAGNNLQNEQLLGNVALALGTITVAIPAFEVYGNVVRFSFQAAAGAGPMSGVLRVGCV